MNIKKECPAAVGAGRAMLHVETLGGAFDFQNPTQLGKESPAVRHLLRRYRLPLSHARLVAELAGMGGRHA